MARGVGLQDANPDVLVGFHLVDRGFETGGNIAVHRIAGIGTIQRDEGNFSGYFVGDDLRI